MNITHEHNKRFNVYCSLAAKERKTKPVECKNLQKEKSFFVVVVVIFAG